MQQHIDLKIVEKPEDAPNYNRDTFVRGLLIHQMVIVRRGTQGGRPTVDLCLRSQDGSEEFTTIVTAALLAQVGGIYRVCNEGEAGKADALDGLPAYMVRVFLELEELQEKVSALDRFISHSGFFANLEEDNPDEAVRLRRQLGLMVDYCDVLKKRLEAAKKGKND